MEHWKQISVNPADLEDDYHSKYGELKCSECESSISEDGVTLISTDYDSFVCAADTTSAYGECIISHFEGGRANTTIKLERAYLKLGK